MTVLPPLRAALLCLGVCAALVLALDRFAEGARNDLTLVSRATGGAVADGNSGGPAISDDGRFVAFHSDADNLSSEDENAVSNIFVRDLRTNTTTLASRSAGPGGATGDDDSTARPALSADGRIVAFQSLADNLSSEDDDRASNIFARDLRDNTTTLVSRASGPGGAGADQEAFSPAISADGRRVAFGSGADNLSSEDDDTQVDIFVRDLRDDTTTLVTRASGPRGAGGDGVSLSPAISADGRLVAFSSQADNLSEEDDDAVQDIFVRDLRSNRTTLVSRAPGPGAAAANGGSFGPLDISADGRFVAFVSDADNLSNEDDDSVANVVVRDLRRNTTTLVSRVTGVHGAGANGDSGNPAISADGRLVVFSSFANNLSAEDDNAVLNLYVRDLRANTTRLVSRAAGIRGASANDSSYGPAIAGGGRLVGFDTHADNLSGEDDNAVQNVFVRELAGRPSQASARCGGRVATIVGSRRGDVIRGTADADVIAALAGDDVVRSLEGNDTVCLGGGDDLAFGGGRADRILGGAGNDRIAGEAGGDVLDGGPGGDVLIGGPGFDVARGAAGRDTCRAERRLGC